MDVEDAGSDGGVTQAKEKPLPEYPAANRNVDALAVHNATGSLEMMGQLALNEWELLRHNIREFGRKIRQVSANVAAATIQRMWTQLLSLLRRHSDSIPAQFELDAAFILNEMERARERPPPRDTLLDVRRVLMEDVDEEGIVHAVRTPRWREMPPPRRRDGGGAGGESPMRSLEGDTSAYQLFNRPMTVADDEFDRLSLPSTTFAQSESERILSLEAQLALLNRQLNILMSNGLPVMGGGGGGESQRPSRPVSRSHSRASLYQQNQMMNTSMTSSSSGFAASQSHGGRHHHNHHHHQQHSVTHHGHHNHSGLGGHSSPSPTSDDDGVYMLNEDSTTSSYASPSHTTTIPPAPLFVQQQLPVLQLLQQPQVTVAGRRESMIMTGDASSVAAIPLAPPLPPFLLQAPPTGGTPSSEGERTLRASSPSAMVLPYAVSSFDQDDHLFPSSSPSCSPSSPPASPLPPPPPIAVLATMQRVNTQESSLSAADCTAAAAAAPATAPGRSFLDDISKGNFALRKASTEKSPSGSSHRSSTSGEDEAQEEEEGHDENTGGPLVKPTSKQLLSRKDTLRRISTDRSPGGTPQNRFRRRMPSLGKDGGKGLFQGDYLAAALANKFNTIRVNEEDDDQSVTAGDQSWIDE